MKRLKVVVIEDGERNQESALLTMPDHQVTILKTAVEAYQFFKKSFEADVILTDLFMPFVGDYTKTPINVSSVIKAERRAGVEFDSMEEFENRLLPLGLIWAMKGVELGIPTGIVTDENHHANIICGMLDIFGFGSNPKITKFDSSTERYGASLKDGEIREYTVSDDENRCKNWGAVLQTMIEVNNL